MAKAPDASGSKRDTNLKTAQMVQEISEIGPDIPEIARKLGQYKESVRYRYKEKILSRKMAVQAAIDYEKLGMRRVIFIVDFREEYEQYAPTILTAMSELCYVTGFDRTLPEGSYVINASVPDQFVDQYVGFVKELESKGLFRCSKILTFEWFRVVPMQAKFYDFDTGRWDFDWSAPSKPGVWRYLPSKRDSFDYTDLLILKELRVDASRSMIEISKKLGIEYKKLMWHYNTHVVGRKLLRGYTLNWMGTSYDFKIEKALHRQHRYFAVDLLVENLTELERMELMAKTNTLPFLWSELVGESYWAQFAFPVDNIIEAYQYIANVIKPFKSRAKLFVADQLNALSFTVSYRLFDERTKEWKFERQELITRFEDLLLRIGQSSS